MRFKLVISNMGRGLEDNAAREPGSIVNEASGRRTIKPDMGTTNALDESVEAPGGSSSGNFCQIEQGEHLKDPTVTADTMATKIKTVPNAAPSTCETADDLKPVTHKVTLKHPIGESSDESEPVPKKHKIDHQENLAPGSLDIESQNAANSTHNIELENGPSPPAQQHVLHEQKTEPGGTATPSHSQGISPSSENPDQENGQPPSVLQLHENLCGMLGEHVIINEGALGTPLPPNERLILLRSPDQYGNLVMSLNYYMENFGEIPTDISVPQYSVHYGRHIPEINSYLFIPVNEDFSQLFNDSDNANDGDVDAEADDAIINEFSRN
ncbi:uncharacterized protein [Macrobrachium rosenbergii]|uniref:uncharacterized protein isoform X3 n=2 Tax=Macrobrachium rosenbergii TaxID=79674 RepID=UPI0034D63C8F